ncbi:hypothetical protein ACO1O0_004908 [Amphichorda felina]
MAEQESVRLERIPAPGPETSPERSDHDAEHGSSESPDESQAAGRWESKARRCVIIGGALSQLPIWGFAINYGMFQEHYSSVDWDVHGSRDTTGVIGTTLNGVMYLSMPPLFALLSLRYAHLRRKVALAGTALACASFLLSSWATQVWHLVALQGVVAAFGGALVYSPLTLSVGEWFHGRNRAVALAVMLSCKNIVGSACPFMFGALLDRYGFRTTLRVWTAITAATSVLAVWLVPTHPSRTAAPEGGRHHHHQVVPWHFLRHPTIYVYGAATMLQTAGYGIPQTYLNTYAHDAVKLSQTTATLLLTLFNVPGIFASAFFGYLTDNRFRPVSSATATAISGVSASLSAFLLWGLTSQGSMALLTLFSITFGFFAGGYSATWGGIINEMEREAASWNEAIDTGTVYGMLNGARGLGYVAGGLAGVPLLKSGVVGPEGRFGYGTSYGPLIIFTGLSSIFGGWAILWRGADVMRRVRGHGPRLGMAA